MKTVYITLALVAVAIVVFYFATRKKCTCGQETDTDTTTDKLPTLPAGTVAYTGSGAFVPSYKPQVS